MKTVCLIPARSGSKGLPNKNMLFLDGKPMIFHTIDAALESGCFSKEDIYVSTDSEIYKEICETKGINVILRPKELSTDSTTSFEVSKNFLESFEGDRIFVLLQVTSPLRNGDNIREAMDMYLQGDCENLVSFSKVEKSPKFFSTIDEEGFAKDICGVDRGYRRQNNKEAFFAPNGAIYITSKDVYLKNETYFTKKTKAYVMKKEDSIDVDDRLDFTSVIGRIFFDYKKRELKNKPLYKNTYLQLSQKRKNVNIILGDSRLVDLEIENFDNFSIPGVTLNVMLENLDVILNSEIKKVVLSLGINDLISSHSVEYIKDNFKKALERFLSLNIEIVLTNIVYTLFRDSVSNSDVLELNNYLLELSKQHNIKFIDINKEISKDNNLKYKYTNDGLHFNKEGQNIVNKIIKANS